MNQSYNNFRGDSSIVKANATTTAGGEMPSANVSILKKTLSTNPPPHLQKLGEYVGGS